MITCHRLFCWLNVIAPLKNYRQVHFTKIPSASTFADTISNCTTKNHQSVYLQLCLCLAVGLCAFVFDGVIHKIEHVDVQHKQQNYAKWVKHNVAIE